MSTPVKKRKVCNFCKQGLSHIDYKSSLLLRYTSEYGRIKPKYYTGVCLNHQKKLANAIKIARIMALIPFVK